jgi:hypothetical protein
MTIVKLLFAIALAASVAAGQTKLSGAAQCPGNPTESHNIELGDRPGHAFGIAKGTCTWTKPAEIAGLKTKDYTGVSLLEIDGNKFRYHASAMGSMDNGDKYFARLQGTTTMKDQKIWNDEGTWIFTGGTGKLKGLKGKGTYKCTPEGDNGNCDMEGEYSLPSQ